LERVLPPALSKSDAILDRASSSRLKGSIFDGG